MPVTEERPPDRSEQVRRLFQPVLDLIFPPRCVVCGRPGDELCTRCLATFSPLGSSICRVCGVALPTPGLCWHCRTQPPAFTRVRSAFHYEDGLRRAIHAFKYEGHRTLAVPLAAAMARVLPPPPTTVLLCAVPLSPAREAERGYNQAELLARELARCWGARPAPQGALRRVRETLPQVELDYRTRQENVAGAFTARSAQVRDATIILVDDVCTTGATLNACSEALLKGGACSVSAVTLARATFKPAGYGSVADL